MTILNGNSYILISPIHWKDSNSNDWSVEMISFKPGKELGKHYIDNELAIVFELQDGKIVAQTDAFLTRR